MADRGFGDKLEQAWDAVWRGEALPPDLDAWLVGTLHDVHARDLVPQPDPRFVQNLRKELLTVAANPSAEAIRDPRAPNSHPAPDP